MTSQDPIHHVQRPIMMGMIRRLTVLIVLLATLMGVLSCRPISDPTIGANQDTGTRSGRSTPPASDVASVQLTATPPTSPAGTQSGLGPAQVPLIQDLRFGHLTTDDGLSNDQVWDVVQDNDGFMWFATVDGLNRFDGVTFKIFRHDLGDPNSLSQSYTYNLLLDQSGALWVGTWNCGLSQYDRETERFIRYRHGPDDDPHSLSNDSVRAIHEDRAGTIWVGTLGGLNKLDRESGQFTHYRHDPDDPHSLSHDTVWAVFEDGNRVLWVGTADGLDYFDRGTETFIHYRHDPNDPQSLSHNTIRSIYEDGSGTLWVGTLIGLNRFNRETEKFTRYQYDATDPQSLSNDYVFSIYEDHAGDLWVGTRGGGLNRFDRETETFTRYQHNAADPYSLSGDGVVGVYGDQNGLIWIASDGGISLLDGEAKSFRHYRAISGNPNSLSHNVVRSLFVDRTGGVWVGTIGGGLNRFDPQTDEFSHYRLDPTDPNSPSSDAVWAVYGDQEGMIWVDGATGRLESFDPETERFTHYVHHANDPNSLSNRGFVYIYEDRGGTVWIGTWGGGLNAFDRETGQFAHFQHDPADPQSLSHNQVTCIVEDRAGMLWVGTSQGLNQFDRESGMFTRYQHDPTDPNSLVQDSVFSVFEDRTGTLWIGTTGGLDKFDRASGRFTHYSLQDGLPSETIYGILEEDASPDGEGGDLWLSTANGLSRFDPQTETFRNYDVSDGLQGNSFLGFSAFAKSPSGELFFGGTNGFNAFYPDQIKDNMQSPPVMITDFQLANKPVPIGGDSVLQQSILETDELVLSYLDRVFSFEFAALNFRAPEKNLYKYRMEGFEEDWNEVDSTRRFATYTNLDPGDYVFRVIGSNNDGIWNEEGASLNITVTPPWWETTWFRIGLVVLAVGLLVGGFRWRVRTIEARSRKLEIQVVERTQELQIASQAAGEAQHAAEAANQAKSMFLANMSHELRTPLNAILGFARLMARDPGVSTQQHEMLDIIDRSGEHLLGMVDDVLSLSRIEAGRIELKEETFDIGQMLEDIGRIFRSRAEGKGLRFHLDVDAELAPWLQGDAGKLRQVLINLLGNAVKFTQEEGDVWLRARSQSVAGDPDMAMLQLEVEDNGPGIPQDKLDGVFEAFVQDEQPRDTGGGTGLGLTISKSLAEMMHGEIAVESEPGRGTLFRVNVLVQLAEEGAETPGEAPVTEVIGLQAGQPAWRILVVDDNRENLLLLTSLLAQAGFTVKEAQNGQEAVAMFEEWRPHFIWMDMRMPVTDGYEATQKIRGLPGGDAVAIVAVTASVLEEQWEEILAAGCDDLVRKPFRDHEIFEAMARQLEVKYVYQERVEEAAPTQGIVLTAEMLADLPPELLEELRQTTLALNREATLEVIERIEDQAPDTARGLRALVEGFRMERIGGLLEETEKRHG